MQKTPSLSYWEYNSWFSQVDFTIVGSGITGLSCALNLRNRYPKSKILILERGSLPQGASTKNAGFACFGSLSEIISDLKTHSEEDLLKLIRMRVDGLQLLRETLGDKTLDYKKHGGYELFFDRNEELFESCLEQRQKINNYLKPVFKQDIFSETPNSFGFQKIKTNLIFNSAEGQLDTGSMMQGLLKLVLSSDIHLLNNFEVTGYQDLGSSGISVQTNSMEFKTAKLFIATNGFASQLGIEGVQAARSQVLVTKPLKNLRVKGTFHLDEGYVYFRNVGDRILLGGGRNIDKEREQTAALETTQTIQDYLDQLLAETILPEEQVQIEHRWSGILGIGEQKKPVVKSLSGNVFCGVRMGGMGVAIGSLIGKELAQLAG